MSPLPSNVKSIVYTVPSATRPGLTHQVTRTLGKFSCDCEAGRQGGKCWHVRAAMAGAVSGKPFVKLASPPTERASELLWN